MGCWITSWTWLPVTWSILSKSHLKSQSLWLWLISDDFCSDFSHFILFHWQNLFQGCPTGKIITTNEIIEYIVVIFIQVLIKPFTLKFYKWILCIICHEFLPIIALRIWWLIGQLALVDIFLPDHFLHRNVSRYFEVRNLFLPTT